MEYAEHVDVAARESSRLVAALRDGPLDVGVPTCPEWTVGDLVVHVTAFAAFWLDVLDAPDPGRGRPEVEWQDPPGGASVDRFEELAGTLVDALRAEQPDTPAWTWAPDDQSVGFIGRRVAHELTVHRFDAQSARGAAEPIDAPLAADGIEEIFVMVAARRAAGGSGETLHLHGAGGHEWLVTLGPEGLDVSRRHAKGDLALRGAEGDLELVLYGRPPVGAVEQFGDPAVLDTWRGVFQF